MNRSITHLLDTNEISRTLELLVEPGQVVEVRTLNATTYASPRYPYQASGYFDAMEQLALALTDLKSARGVYITLQPCRRELLARAHNRLRSAEEMRADKSSTSDQHILRYRWLLLDCDPDRPAGISSSDEEHTLALQHAEHIKTTLKQEGWPDPIMADSGNGAHLLYRIDLPVDESEFVRRVLEGLAAEFDLPTVHLDQKVFNPSRISKLYGTLACKGDNTSDRPHRMARLLSLPDQIVCVERSQLEAVAAPKQHTSSLLKQMKEASASFDLDAWIAKHGLDLIGPSSWKDGGRRWVFPVCPWNSEHTDKSAYIVQHDNGAIAAGCQHNSCRGKGWHDLRALYEPTFDGNRLRYKGDVPFDDASTLPQIIVGEQLRITRDQALHAWALAEQAHPTVFVQSARLVQVCKDKEDRPMLRNMGVAEIRNALTNAADFFQAKAVRGQPEKVRLDPISPPRELAEQILALPPSTWPFKPLLALVEIPVLRPDGTILATAGYDETTRLYYLPPQDMKPCSVPLFPTRAEVEAAVALLLKAIGDFPYEQEADRANLLGLLLTPIIRSAIKGHIQLAILDATNPGVGKGLIGNFIAIIVTGKQIAVLTAPEDDEEWDKRITAKLLGGATLIVIDNIAGRLQSSNLEAVLTTGEYEGRMLGQSKMIKVVNQATWIANGNNLKIGGDLYRRCYRIRLVSAVSNPEERDDFAIPDLLDWTEEHRSELIAALLTLTRAWYVAGRPKPKGVPKLGSFKHWAQTVGGILQFAGIEGFQGNRELLKAETDDETQQWEQFLAGWKQVYGTTWISVAKLVEKITGTGGLLGNSGVQFPPTTLAQALPESLHLALKEKPHTFGMKLSKALEKRVKRCYGKENLRIEQQMEKHSKQKVWRVAQMVSEHPALSSPPSKRKEEQQELEQGTYAQGEAIPLEQKMSSEKTDNSTLVPPSEEHIASPESEEQGFAALTLHFPLPATLDLSLDAPEKSEEFE